MKTVGVLIELLSPIFFKSNLVGEFIHPNWRNILTSAFDKAEINSFEYTPTFAPIIKKQNVHFLE